MRKDKYVICESLNQDNETFTSIKDSIYFVRNYTYNNIANDSSFWTSGMWNPKKWEDERNKHIKIKDARYFIGSIED